MPDEDYDLDDYYEDDDDDWEDQAEYDRDVILEQQELEDFEDCPYE